MSNYIQKGRDLLTQKAPIETEQLSKQFDVDYGKAIGLIESIKAKKAQAEALAETLGTLDKQYDELIALQKRALALYIADKEKKLGK